MPREGQPPPGRRTADHHVTSLDSPRPTRHLLAHSILVRSETMRIGLSTGALLAAIPAFVASLGVGASPAFAAFDTKLVIAPTSSKTIKAEKPSAAQDYVDHTAIYIRFLPIGGPKRPLPVFISTHNYLTCP